MSTAIADVVCSLQREMRYTDCCNQTGGRRQTVAGAFSFTGRGRNRTSEDQDLMKLLLAVIASGVLQRSIASNWWLVWWWRCCYQVATGKVCGGKRMMD